MILTCPNCRSRYLVGDNAIPPAGRAVRCAACKHVWTEYPAAEAAAVTEPAMAETQAFAAAAPPMAGRSDVNSMEADAPDTDTEASLAAPPLPSNLKVPLLNGDAPRLGGQTDTAVPGLDVAADSAVHSLRRSMRSNRASSSSARRGSSRKKPKLPVKWIAIGTGAVLLLGSNLLLWKNTLIESSDMFRSFYAAIGMATPVPHDEALGAQVLRISYPPPPAARALENGSLIQEITGSIENPTSRTVRIPTLKGTMLDEAGNVVFSWTFPPPTLVLNGGQTVMFDTTVRDFPSTARQLIIGFDTDPAEAAGNS